MKTELLQPAFENAGQNMVKFPEQVKITFSDDSTHLLPDAMTAYQFVSAILEHRRSLFDSLLSLHRDSTTSVSASDMAELKEAGVFDEKYQLKPIYKSILNCGLIEPMVGKFEMIPPCHLGSDDFDDWLFEEQKFRENFVKTYSFLGKKGGMSL
jgi:hypothetical protein